MLFRSPRAQPAGHGQPPLRRVLPQRRLAAPDADRVEPAGLDPDADTDGELARAEPKRVRYQLAHTAARVTRSARCTTLGLAANWRWTTDLLDAFAWLRALPPAPPDPDPTLRLNNPTPTTPAVTDRPLDLPNRPLQQAAKRHTSSPSAPPGAPNHPTATSRPSPRLSPGSTPRPNPPLSTGANNRG